MSIDSVYEVGKGGIVYKFQFSSESPARNKAFVCVSHDGHQLNRFQVNMMMLDKDERFHVTIIDVTSLPVPCDVLVVPCEIELFSCPF